jgi:hypothetical protein
MAFKLSDLYRDATGKFDPVKAATSAGLGALAYGALKPGSAIGEFIGGKKQQPVGYTGGIPEYGVNRTLLPNAFATTTPTGEPRVPGSGGRRYFSDMTYTPTGDTMSAAINPVNVPVTTRTPAGVFDGLSDEEAQYFFKTLFDGQGISNANVTGTNIANTGTANTNVAGTNIANTGIANTNVAGTNIANTGGATTTVATKPAPKYTDAQVKDTLDTLINRYTTVDPTTNTKATDNPALYRAIGETIKAEIGKGGVTLEGAAKQISDRFRMSDGSVVSPEEIIAAYKQMGFAQGGLASLPQSQGYYLGGTTDGMADQIPASINGSQPAALSDGEFVMPADVVSHLGNGNSDAGAKVLYSMMDRVRQARTGRKEQGREITPNKFTPV